MKGLDEARQLYEDFGRDMLHRRFPEFEGRIAVGLVGRGSECYGFDDALSMDHDFEPGFCLYLTDADDLLIGWRRPIGSCRSAAAPGAAASEKVTAV